MRLIFLVKQMETANDREPIAIIGMACRFPDANTPAAFWRQLRAGLETVTVFTDEELDATGGSSQMYSRPDYVRKRGIIAGTCCNQQHCNYNN